MSDNFISGSGALRAAFLLIALNLQSAVVCDVSLWAPVLPIFKPPPSASFSHLPHLYRRELVIFCVRRMKLDADFGIDTRSLKDHTLRLTPPLPLSCLFFGRAAAHIMNKVELSFFLDTPQPEIFSFFPLTQDETPPVLPLSLYVFCFQAHSFFSLLL